MKSIAIMQPYFFPYLGYFQLINSVNEFILLDDVSFIQKGWINRNRILLNNSDHMFTLPISGVSQNKKINDLYLYEHSKNSEKLIQKLTHAYKRAPYFEEVMPFLMESFRYEEMHLVSYIMHALKLVCTYLKINTPLLLASALDPDKLSKGQERLITLCKLCGADVYYNAIGGKDLYSAQAFKEKNIDLRFLQPNLKSYRQFGAEFVPALSIIDLMMFLSSEELQKALQDYTLISG